MPDKTSNNSPRPSAGSIQTILQTKKIDRREAEILLAFVLRRPRELILAHPETELPFWRRVHFNSLIKTRAAGVPLAQLTGHKEFFGLTFFVSRATLIPRPETETMVEAALGELKTAAGEWRHVTASTTTLANTVSPAEKTRPREIIRLGLIDIGTGTGCIPIAILKNLPPEYATLPTTHSSAPTADSTLISIIAYATDSSRAALRLARQNARRHSVNINFTHGNLFTKLNPWANKTWTGQATPKQIIITANLPYLTNEEYQAEPTLRGEPGSALLGGGRDGLNLYRELLAQLAHWQKPYDLTTPFTLLCEINPDQLKAMQNAIVTHFPQATIMIKKDLAGRERVVIVKNGYT